MDAAAAAPVDVTLPDDGAGQPVFDGAKDIDAPAASPVSLPSDGADRHGIVEVLCGRNRVPLQVLCGAEGHRFAGFFETFECAVGTKRYVVAARVFSVHAPPPGVEEPPNAQTLGDLYERSEEIREAAQQASKFAEHATRQGCAVRATYEGRGRFVLWCLPDEGDRHTIRIVDGLPSAADLGLGEDHFAVPWGATRRTAIPVDLKALIDPALAANVVLRDPEQLETAWEARKDYMVKLGERIQTICVRAHAAPPAPPPERPAGPEAPALEIYSCRADGEPYVALGVEDGDDGPKATALRAAAAAELHAAACRLALGGDPVPTTVFCYTDEIVYRFRVNGGCRELWARRGLVVVPLDEEEERTSAVLDRNLVPVHASELLRLETALWNAMCTAADCRPVERFRFAASRPAPALVLQSELETKARQYVELGQRSITKLVSEITAFELERKKNASLPFYRLETLHQEVQRAKAEAKRREEAAKKRDEAAKERQKLDPGTAKKGRARAATTTRKFKTDAERFEVHTSPDPAYMNDILHTEGRPVSSADGAGRPLLGESFRPTAEREVKAGATVAVDAARGQVLILDGQRTSPYIDHELVAGPVFRRLATGRRVLVHGLAPTGSGKSKLGVETVLKKLLISPDMRRRGGARGQILWFVNAAAHSGMLKSEPCWTRTLEDAGRVYHELTGNAPEEVINSVRSYKESHAFLKEACVVFCTVESLPKLFQHVPQFDAVFIDEASKIMEILTTSGTVVEELRQLRALRALAIYLRTTPLVFCMDADYTPVEREFFAALFRGGTSSVEPARGAVDPFGDTRAGQGPDPSEPAGSAREWEVAYIKTGAFAPRNTWFAGDARQCKRFVASLLLLGKKVFFVSNTQRTLVELEAYLSRIELLRGIRVLVIHGKSPEKVKALLQDPAALAEYDLVCVNGVCPQGADFNILWTGTLVGHFDPRIRIDVHRFYQRLRRFRMCTDQAAFFFAPLGDTGPSSAPPRPVEEILRERTAKIAAQCPRLVAEDLELRSELALFSNKEYALDVLVHVQAYIIANIEASVRYPISAFHAKLRSLSPASGVYCLELSAFDFAFTVSKDERGSIKRKLRDWDNETRDRHIACPVANAPSVPPTGKVARELYDVCKGRCGDPGEALKLSAERSVMLQANWLGEHDATLAVAREGTVNGNPVLRRMKRFSRSLYMACGLWVREKHEQPHHPNSTVETNELRAAALLFETLGWSLPVVVRGRGETLSITFNADARLEEPDLPTLERAFALIDREDCFRLEDRKRCIEGALALLQKAEAEAGKTLLERLSRPANESIEELKIFWRAARSLSAANADDIEPRVRSIVEGLRACGTMRDLLELANGWKADPAAHSAVLWLHTALSPPAPGDGPRASPAYSPRAARDRLRAVCADGDAEARARQAASLAGIDFERAMNEEGVGRELDRLVCALRCWGGPRFAEDAEGTVPLGASKDWKSIEDVCDRAAAAWGVRIMLVTPIGAARGVRRTVNVDADGDAKMGEAMAIAGGRERARRKVTGAEAKKYLSYDAIDLVRCSRHVWSMTKHVLDDTRLDSADAVAYGQICAAMEGLNVAAAVVHCARSLDEEGTVPGQVETDVPPNERIPHSVYATGALQDLIGVETLAHVGIHPKVWLELVRDSTLAQASWPVCDGATRSAADVARAALIEHEKAGLQLQHCATLEDAQSLFELIRAKGWWCHQAVGAPRTLFVPSSELTKWFPPSKGETYGFCRRGRWNGRASVNMWLETAADARIAEGETVKIPESQKPQHGRPQGYYFPRSFCAIFDESFCP
eukprot:tig00020553_g10527.t1